jgi:hypothetical protein
MKPPVGSTPHSARRIFLLTYLAMKNKPAPVPQTRSLAAASVRGLKFFLMSFFVGCVAMVRFAAADPVENLKSFSEFRSVNLSRMLAGDIIGESGSLMEFPQGIVAQTCFVVPLTAAEAARRLQVWDPSRHEAPNVLAFNFVRAPCKAADFESLNLKPSHKALRWLLDKSLATTDSKSELNLTYSEARQLAECAKDNPDSQGLNACWAKLLLKRATEFQRKGFDGVLPYEANGKTVSPAQQLRAMLSENPAVAREFAPLLQQCGVLGNKPTGTLTPFHYWGLCEANRHGTLNLGAVYLLPLGDHYQLLDVQYYVSGTYYTFVTLYEVWPIRVGEQSATLVWRGDFFAAPTLAFTKGVERLAYGVIMLQELKKAIRCFQDDVMVKNR